jgi:hypothetical protein
MNHNNIGNGGRQRNALSSVDFYRRVPKDLTEVCVVTSIMVAKSLAVGVIYPFSLICLLFLLYCHAIPFYSISFFIVILHVVVIVVIIVLLLLL